MLRYTLLPSNYLVTFLIKFSFSRNQSPSYMSSHLLMFIVTHHTHENQSKIDLFKIMIALQTNYILQCSFLFCRLLSNTFFSADYSIQLYIHLNFFRAILDGWDFRQFLVVAWRPFFLEGHNNFIIFHKFRFLFFLNYLFTHALDKNEIVWTDLK